MMRVNTGASAASTPPVDELYLPPDGEEGVVIYAAVGKHAPRQYVVEALVLRGGRCFVRHHPVGHTRVTECLASRVSVRETSGIEAPGIDHPA